MVTAFLDIETTPIEFEDKDIINYLMEKKFKRFSHPLFGKIISIGIKIENEEPRFFYGNDEKEILTNFWQFLAENKIDKIVTWNGYEFDIPLIKIRSVINAIKQTKIVNLNKWKMLESNHIDCMRYFSVDDTFANVSMEIVCRLMNIEVPKDRIGGEHIEKLVKKEDWEAIVNKNEQDLTMLENIYRKIESFIL